MNIGKARALFEQVASGEYHGSAVGEYLEAVKIVLDMETHNSISKKMIISVCKWLVEIAEKAVSPYRWIPVSERMPEEHESMFAKYYNTPKWNNSMWLKESDKMLVSIEVPGNEIIIDTAKMLDGKWFFGLSFVDKKVIAWMPLPEVYKPNK